ncbi:MAG: ABC transporter substrate-binding protein [Clostridiales bacterium]|jgi:putative aldouronate transport system substrate-binding protein|nr:ABC transporter substrate-binding protein [Clostridiales bacterium]
MLKLQWARAIALVLILMSMASCGEAQTSETPAEGAPGISQHVDLTMYLLGDVPADQELVQAELNKQLNEKLNVTLTTKYLSWGDYMTKYSLILASGQDVDLIYTSDWAFYPTEAAKGAFYELTDEFMELYMPNVLKTQAPESLNQARINGKLYAIPKNNTGLEGESYVMIRKDLREKYGMGTIDSLEKLEEYFKAVLANESGILPYAANYDAGGFYMEAYLQPNSIYGAGPGYSYSAASTEAPEFSELEYTWFREDIIPYYERMKQWAEWGFWSKNAISNTEATRDAFENGKSASLGQNPGTLYTAGRNLSNNNPEWTYEVLDVCPGTNRHPSMYTGDCMAIADASKKPERTAMLIDLIKSDLDVYLCLVGGIEGKHYVLDEDGSRLLGPEADKYPWDSGTWGFRWNDAMLPRDASMTAEQAAFEEGQKKLFLAPDVLGFRFDREPVKNEMAAVEAIADEYVDMFHLGMVPDIRGTVAEWKAKTEAAGLPVIEAEFEKQYNAWKATLK